MSCKTLYKMADDTLQLLMQHHARLANERNVVNNKIMLEELPIMKQFNFSHLLQSLVKDLLESNLYTLNGLAREIDAPVELLADLFLKQHCDPSYSLAMTILYLHRETFPKVYERLKDEEYTQRN